MSQRTESDRLFRERGYDYETQPPKPAPYFPLDGMDVVPREITREMIDAEIAKEEQLQQERETR